MRKRQSNHDMKTLDLFEAIQSERNSEITGDLKSCNYSVSDSLESNTRLVE